MPDIILTPSTPLRSSNNLHLAKTVVNENVMAGVQEGTINRQEFLDLNSDMSDISDIFMKADYQSDKDLQQMAALRQRALQQKVARYNQGDYSPTVRPSGTIGLEQQRQSGQIFDGLSEGTVSRKEGLTLLTINQSVSGLAAQSQPAARLNLKLNAEHIAKARAGREPNANDSSLSTAGQSRRFGPF